MRHELTWYAHILGPPGPDIPGTNTDPATIIPKIYPILGKNTLKRKPRDAS
jgi:hypothetical protein